MWVKERSTESDLFTLSNRTWPKLKMALFAYLDSHPIVDPESYERGEIARKANLKSNTEQQQ
jgi:hypothetical protein